MGVLIELKYGQSPVNHVVIYIYIYMSTVNEEARSNEAGVVGVSMVVSQNY